MSVDKFNLEFNLVKFPILFPIIYGLILYSLPQYETVLIFITILLLAETHFGATWPFFLNKSNSDLIEKNKIYFISFPVLIVILSILGFIFIKPTFLLIFFAANMYHVTRQSFGICKLYSKEIKQIKFQEIFIYIFNSLFFFVGFFRFYFPIIENEHLFNLNIVILLLISLILIFYIYKFKSAENIYPFITGLIIFYPICFVGNPVHSIIMGVTMHYTQYLYLTHKVYKGRSSKDVIQMSMSSYLGMIIFYSVIMSLLSLFGKSSNEIFSQIIIIPIIGQMLHFYLDSQLWKFSNPHNRENVLSYIKKI